MQYTDTRSIKNILQDLVNKSGISESELTRKIKIPTATFNKIKTGKINDPRSSTLKTIANYFSLSIDQLLGYAPITSIEQSTLLYVPILPIDKITKINVNELTYNNHKDWVSFYPNVQLLGHKIIAFKVNGDAMFPFFDNSTLAIIDCDQKGESMQYVLAHIESSKDFVLRQLVCDGKFRILKPFNPLFNSISLSEKDKILGVIINSIRTFK